MDNRRFDSWVQEIAASHSSRRVALSGLVSALAGGLVARLTESASARKRKNRKKSKKKKRKNACTGEQKRCGEACILQSQCCSAADCPSDATCEDGACLCPSGQTECTGSCVDLASDSTNCGACGNVCSSGTCSSGNCSCTRNTDCPDGCSCGVRAQGGTVCREIGVLSEPCEVDSDCADPGDFCLNNNFCTAPCRG
jgi:hypothetical protein